MYKGQYAPNRVISVIYCVILNRLPCKSLKFLRLESTSRKGDDFCPLSGTWSTRTGRTRSESNAKGGRNQPFIDRIVSLYIDANNSIEIEDEIQKNQGNLWNYSREMVCSTEEPGEIDRTTVEKGYTVQKNPGKSIELR